MGRGVILGLSVLAFGCSGDGPLDRSEDPARADCTCRLDTQIDNLGICFSPTTAFAPAHVFSSSVRDGGTGPECESWRDPQPVPVASWTKLRVSAPCTGSGQLCIAVRAGDSEAPLASDCALASRCSALDYATAGTVLELSPLDSWVAESSECSKRYEQLGGYLEFTLASATLGCGRDATDVRRLAICPTRCQLDASGPGCDVCGSTQIITSF